MLKIEKINCIWLFVIQLNFLFTTTFYDDPKNVADSEADTSDKEH